VKIQQLAVVAVFAVSIALAGGCQPKKGGSSGGGTTATPATGSTKIPDTARRIKESPAGTRLIHHPLRDGTVYVQDVSTGKLAYTGPVTANSTIVVDPNANALTVNDQQVKKDPKLNAQHPYRLYFEPK